MSAPTTSPASTEAELNFLIQGVTRHKQLHDNPWEVDKLTTKINNIDEDVELVMTNKLILGP